MLSSYAFRQLMIPVEQLKDVAERLYGQVVAQPWVFDVDTSRERMAEALGQTRTVHLRRPKIDPREVTGTLSTANILECYNSQLFAMFPLAGRLIQEVSRYEGGFTQLGRAFITYIKAGGSIAEHIDEGLYFETLRRYHVPLKVEGECYFHALDQSQMMRVGEAWELNNSVLHSVDNSKGQDRYHLIFDAVV